MSDQFPSLLEVLQTHVEDQLTNYDTERDECGCRAQKPGQSWNKHVAEVWREACTVTTVTDLDALPDRAVIIDADDTVLRRNPWHSDSPVNWYPLDGNDAYERDFGIKVDEIPLPARVIHNPDWDTK